MGKNLCYILYLLWLCYLIASSILLFTKGFLLTRDVLDLNATCTTNPTKSDTEPCLPQQARVILFVIDALRYDFTLYDETKTPQHFQNKLPIIHQLLKETNNSRLYKFIADPPTTTMQRLKALTTGSLPTFIDAGSNFATPEINEDNLIDQVRRHNGNVVFMGDDTWTGLYPDRFIRSYAYPSFSVWDLDTVDSGVRTNIFSELQRSDWNLLVAHCLGVDHAGHAFGPFHKEMARKLTEMNNLIKEIVEVMSEDMVLYVIGDHGMTVRGEHGGGSEDEVNSAMFIYSKSNLPYYTSKQEVKQVDIVPTLAFTLGIPIPFQNLGSVVLNSIPVQDWKQSLTYLEDNLDQIMRYVKEYSKKKNTFDERNLKEYFSSYERFKERLGRIETEEDFKTFAKECGEFIESVRKMCEDVWVQYDAFNMTRGLLFLFLSIFFNYIIIDGIPRKELGEILQGPFLKFAYTVIFGCGAASTILVYVELVDSFVYTLFFLSGIASQFLYVLLIVQNWDLISNNWHDRRNRDKLSGLACRLVLMFNLLGLFSNSYIVEESFVLLFLLITVIFVGIIVISTALSFKRKWIVVKLILFAFGAAILIRFSLRYMRCREEQLWCFDSPEKVNEIIAAKIDSSKMQLVVTIVTLALFVITLKVWLRTCGNLNGYSGSVTAAKHLPTVIVVCIAAYWAMQKLPKASKPLQYTNGMAWAAYSFIALGILSTVFQPVLAYVYGRCDSNNLVPYLFNKVKNTLEGKEEAPVIYGLGTVYSAAFVIVGSYLTLLFSLLLGDAVGPTAIIMFLSASSVLIITSLLRIEKAGSVDELFSVPNLSVLTWVVLSQYFFYGTGHQATLPNIQWEAAFVGLKGLSVPNFIPAGLVIANTFCSHVLMGFMLPLLLIAPFAMFIMLPSFVGRKKELAVLGQRGEVLLWEKSELMGNAMFGLVGRYVMCHAIRVFASMLAATIHCRHLMVWKIFAPKFIFESIGMMVTMGAVICGYLLMLRLHNKIDRWVSQLNKLS